MGADSRSQLGMCVSDFPAACERHIVCSCSPSEEIHSVRHLRRCRMHALRTIRLRHGSFFVFALWMAGLVAAGCGGNPADPGTTTADQTAGNSANGGSSTGPGSLKVTLCHIPPGNPANAHTITVGEPAMRAHLAHGDYLGPCNGTGGGGSNPGGGAPGPAYDGGTPNPPGGGPPCVETGSSCSPSQPPCCTGLICSPMGQCAPRLN